MKSILIIISILTFSILDLSCNSSRDRGNPADYMYVKSVVDGDTFWADDGRQKGIKIRLIGVDAPESRNTGQKRIGYYGKQSKEYLTKMLANKRIRLEYDVGKKDQYNRTLAYVYLTDGTFVNAEIVKEGYAMVMTVPPNVKYAEKFVILERRARRNNRGLWDKSRIK